jgi:hypothetical protein
VHDEHESACTEAANPVASSCMTLTMTPRAYPVASLCKDSNFGDVATNEEGSPPVASLRMTGRKRPSRKGSLTLI